MDTPEYFMTAHASHKNIRDIPDGLPCITLPAIMSLNQPGVIRLNNKIQHLIEWREHTPPPLSFKQPPEIS